MLDRSRHLAQELQALTENSRTELDSIRSAYERKAREIVAANNAKFTELHGTLRRTRSRLRVTVSLLILAIALLAWIFTR
jgi:hypothetical protein